MSVSWGDYSPFDPGVARPLHEVTGREARAAFRRLMDAKRERGSELRRLLDGNGVVLAGADAGLQLVNDWFLSEVEGVSGTGRLRSLWYAVVNDLALFLGDVMIERRLNLQWVLFDKRARDVCVSAARDHGVRGRGQPEVLRRRRSPACYVRASDRCWRVSRD